MKYNELEQKLIDRANSKLKKFKISYYYLATGMEGIPDIFPEKIIEAPTEEMAVYIYSLMFFGATSLEEIQSIRAYNGANYSFKSFENFIKEEEKDYWGITIKEI